MASLTDMLGQSVLVRKLYGLLAPPGARILLSGPSGSGKTTVLRLLEAELEQFGFVIRFKGDVQQAGMRFLSANRSLAGRRLRRQVRDAFAGGVISPVRLVPVAGPVLGELAKIAVAALGHSRPEFLTSDQQDLLGGMQGLARDWASGTLIIDDIQWLDADTAQLLLLLTEPEVIAAYPFAKGIRILVAETTGCAPTLAPSLLSRLQQGIRVDCSMPDRTTFGLALQTFGMRPPHDEQVINDLYLISGGHLGIAQQIAKTDQGVDLAASLAEGNPSRLMSELLSLRLDRLQGADQLRRLLYIAACSGSSFQEAEVMCAFMDPEAFPAALQAAYREEFLLTDGETLSFAHDSIRGAAERLATDCAADMHSRLALCIKRLRPGDYSARLRHVRLSGNADGLCELAFAVTMEEVRGERLHPSLDRTELGSLEQLLADVRQAFGLMDGGRHREAITLMNGHYTGEAGLVQGEIVSLLALNYIKLRTAESYAEAEGLLRLWQDRRAEPELRQRLMSMLLMALASSGAAEEATQLYTSLASELELGARSDPTLRSRAEALNRKADMFMPSEFAAKHIKRAEAWFGPAATGSPPRNAFEHVACLVNLSGALFTTGQFAEATHAAEAAVRAVGEHRARGLRVPESYKALNNYAVAAFRGGQETALSLASALHAVTEEDERRDRILVGVNAASLLILGGDIASGLERLRAIWENAIAEELDDYYLLYAGSNLAVALAVSGQRSDALDLLTLSEGRLEAVPKWVRQSHRRRLKFLVEAVQDGTAHTTAAIDAYPRLRRAPDGGQDPWRSIGHGFLLSDIQVWSES